jgi:catechol 2,3-dioxygenase-like lactoylglutathione lyase family enzyme
VRIKLTSVLVDDQEKARRFYSEVLGFVVKQDLALGHARWLTVVSPDEPEGVELLLEPQDNPAIPGVAESFKAALLKAGIPYTAFFVEDLEAEYERLARLGVAFKVDPTESGGVRIAVLDDTCGNLIQLVQAE